MQKFIALKQAEDTEYNIRQIVIAARGEAGWRQLKQLRQEEKQQNIEGKYQATKRKNQIINAIGWSVSVFITLGGGYLMYLFAMKYR